MCVRNREKGCYTDIRSRYYASNRQTPVSESFSNMSGTSVCDDKRIRAAVALLLKAPMLTVGQAMRAAKSTDGESKDRTIQMQVRRALKRKRGNVDMDVDPFLTPPVGVGTSVTGIS